MLEKKFVNIILVVLSCLILIPHYLSLGATKDFWGDEYYELIGPLSKTPTDMLVNGAYGTPSRSPLYYMVERPVVRGIISYEEFKGRGFDWRVSLRVLPTVAFILLLVISAIALLQFHPIASFAMVFLMGRNNFAAYYAAETRVYSSWLGFSLLFYVFAFLVTIKPECRTRQIVFSLSALLLPFVMITSPIQVFSVTVVIAIVWWRFKELNKTRAINLVLVLIANFLIYKYYNSGPTLSSQPLSISELLRQLKIEFVPLYDRTLVPLEGMASFTKLVAASTFLCVLGFSTKSKTYISAGAIGLSQLAILMLLPIIHMWGRYFYHERHGIFIVAIQVFVYGILTFAIFDICSRRLGEKTAKFVLGLLLILISGPWFYRRVIKLPQALHTVSNAFHPYCNPQIPAPPTNASIGDLTQLFNEYNVKSHSGSCPPNDSQPTFSPLEALMDKE